MCGVVACAAAGSGKKPLSSSWASCGHRRRNSARAAGERAQQADSSDLRGRQGYGLEPAGSAREPRALAIVLAGLDAAVCRAQGRGRITTWKGVSRNSWLARHRRGECPLAPAGEVSSQYRQARSRDRRRGHPAAGSLSPDRAELDMQRVWIGESDSRNPRTCFAPRHAEAVTEVPRRHLTAR